MGKTLIDGVELKEGETKVLNGKLRLVDGREVPIQNTITKKDGVVHIKAAPIKVGADAPIPGG